MGSPILKMQQIIGWSGLLKIQMAEVELNDGRQGVMQS